MLLEFRTKINVNGNCRYLAIDIDNRVYSKDPAHWICKEVPAVRSCDIDHLTDSLDIMGFKNNNGPIMGA